MCVYKSTQLQELSDLVGLALTHCRAGRVAESSAGEDRQKSTDFAHTFLQNWDHEQAVVSCTAAYESALAVASTEKEKAYILTAQALLQHQQGNLDLAKTLLFKW